MRKGLFFVLLCLVFNNVIAQNISYKQKLYYTCKVWGFVKYYHSNVSNCNVDWDQALLAAMPLIKKAANQSEFNNALDTLLAKAGPMQISKIPFPDVLPSELKRNRNFVWINDSALRADVKTALDTIKNNFRPNTNCWVQNNTYQTSYMGWLVFPHDSLMTDTNAYINFPDEFHRLLILFKHWNIINYFDPYTYIFDKSIDTILINSVLIFANANDYNSFYLAIRKMTAQFDDAHIEGLTYSYYNPFPVQGYFFPRILLKYIQNKYVVVKSGEGSVNVGDFIVSINGLTTIQWEDSLKNYISAGNKSVFRRIMCRYLLSGLYNSTALLTLNDTNNNVHSVTPQRVILSSNKWFPAYYYPADSLNTIKWTSMNCNTGYVNWSNLAATDVPAMYKDLSKKPAIIFDLRNYPIDATGNTIANLMYPDYKVFAKFMEPDVTYPGTFYWTNYGLGINNNASAYNGKVFILMNQETQSAAEFDCMKLSALPNAVKIGSQTAGTDGNITYFYLTQDINSGFTSLGTFYSNGDSTERIGIKPDYVIDPSISGIANGVDEVLNKALYLACQSTGVHSDRNENDAIDIFPNPATNILNIQLMGKYQSQNAVITITETSGKMMLSKNVTITSKHQLDIQVDNLPKGIYLLRVQTDDQVSNVVFLKQ